MDLALFLLAYILFWRCTISSGLRCYACEPRSSTYHHLPRPKVCESFDGSNNYIEQCDTSTMCYKRQSTISFGGITTTTYQRGCAPQTFSGDQVKINKKWQYVTNIYEVYKEDCQTDSDSDSLASTVNCYCRGDLCNGANSISIYQTIIYLIAIYISVVIV